MAYNESVDEYTINESGCIKMLNALTVNDFLKSIVPISRFNKGEANRIFDEVNKTGYKVVVKNNNPTCILVSPEDFSEMLEYAENYALLLEANKRMEKSKKGMPMKDVMKELGITKKDLEQIEVDLD